MGYPEGVKGYRLWCIESNSMGFLTSGDVVFNEAEIPLLKGNNSNLPNSKREGIRETTPIEVELVYDTDT